MGQNDALKLVGEVRRRMVEFSLNLNFLRDVKIANICEKLWNGDTAGKGGLVSDIWVEGSFPPQESKYTLEGLSVENIFPPDLCEHLDKKGVFPKKRYLYSHQAESLRIIQGFKTRNKPSLVITAPTGAGKTESFLLPVISELWSQPTRKTNGGMRCLILYPMNALVADQVERIYEWLKGGDHPLSVFHFTSETPNDYYAANRQGEPKWEGCRKRTRQEARGRENELGHKLDSSNYTSVPDIVITNYSMLEYMLCRPQDACFFGPDLQAIVLDEAHLYTGTLAAEITLLLRRVIEKCQTQTENIIQIATSATLGGDDEDLKQFVSQLFSAKIEHTFLIKGIRETVELKELKIPRDTACLYNEISKHFNKEIHTLTSDGNLIVSDTQVVKDLANVISPLVTEVDLKNAINKYDNVLAKFLFEVLHKSPIIIELIKYMFSEEIVSLNQLAKKTWGVTNTSSIQATILLLRLCASARRESSEMPLLPHRLHLLVRSPEGLSVCLNSNCSGPDELKMPSLGCVQSPADRCQFCNKITLPMHRCDTCGEWALAGHENSEDDIVEPGYFVRPKNHTYYLITPKESQQDLIEIIINTDSASFFNNKGESIKLYKAPCPIHGGACYDKEKCARQKCPNCGVEWSVLSDDDNVRNLPCKPMKGTESLAISLLAETVLAGLPSFPDDTRRWKPGGGKRLLCFSDSRREAARLGPLLTSQHETWIIRSAIARTVQNLEVGDLGEYYKEEIKRVQAKLDIEPKSIIRLQLEKELCEKKTKMKIAFYGMSFTEFANCFVKNDIIKEILHRESGEKHSAEDWNQKSWLKNYENVSRHADALLATELAGPPLKPRISVEAIGLIEIAYPGIDELGPPDELMGVLPKECNKDQLVLVWSKIVAFLLDSLRADRVTGWSQLTERREWQGESQLYEKYCTKNKHGWNAQAFIGDINRSSEKRQLRLYFIENILRKLKCPEINVDKIAVSFLENVFNQLLFAASNKSADFNWLVSEEVQIGPRESARAFKLLLDRLAIKRPATLFRCPSTGTIWSRSVLGWAPIKGCQGNLIEVSHKELDFDLRWGRARRELLESPIFSMGLWGEEHSAQLSPTENKSRQKLFKEGIRNILSSTTTMELGIDIGGLNGVLIGNVPPGKANHLQRAGRAGRRSDGSAIVVTYSRERAFDREVFNNFHVFLKKELRKPNVLIGRERILKRHVYALFLAEFFVRHQPASVGAMSAYGPMGKFCGIGIPQKWGSESQKPTSNNNIEGFENQFVECLSGQLGMNLRRKCSRIVFETKLQNIIDEDDKWGIFIEQCIEQFNASISNWKKDVRYLIEAWEEIPGIPTNSELRSERAKANSLQYQIKARCDLPVIECLANYRFLPRYGFPINLQKLSVRIPKESKPGKSVVESKYRLERSSLLALNEYIPGADILVGGKVAVSRGIAKNWTDVNRDEALGLQEYALKCGGNAHIYTSTSQTEKCPECGESSSGSCQKLLFPKFGYTTAAWEPPKRGGRLDRVGEVETYPISSFTADDGDTVIEQNFAGIKQLKITYKEEAGLLLRNSGDNGYGFAVCSKCGFSMSEECDGQTGIIKLPIKFQSHASIYNSNPNTLCWKKKESAQVLRNRVFAAKEYTDMLLIESRLFNDIRIAGLFSLGRALLLAGCRLLEIDSREIAVELKPLAVGLKGIILYDTTPGGSGHCLELLNLKMKWLVDARNIMKGSDDHHQRCKRACIECILDFSGQFYSDRLNRIEALEILEALLDETGVG
jgi:DEAD/DEAH box helicase domain-containing protein